MRIKQLFFSFLLLFSLLPLIAEDFALPSFYAHMDNSVGILIFDEDIVPVAYQGGKQLEPAARLITGFLAMPFPFSIEASVFFQVPEKEIGIQELILSYFSEFTMVSIGKQKTDWGLGNVFQPLNYLDFVIDPYSKYFIGKDSPYIWQTCLNYYAANNTISLKGFMDDRLIEEQHTPLWWSALLQDQISYSNLTFMGQAALLYEKDCNNFQNEPYSLNFGLESKWILNDLLSLSFAQSVDTLPNFSSFYFEGTALLDLLSSNNEFFFSPEIGYKKNDPLLGLSFGYTSQSNFISTALNFQYDITHPGFMLYASNDLTLTKELTFQVAVSWFKGKEESFFADTDVPFTMRSVLKVSLY